MILKIKMLLHHLVSLNCCEIGLQLCTLHPWYKHGIHCNPIMSFIHSWNGSSTSHILLNTFVTYPAILSSCNTRMYNTWLALKVLRYLYPKQAFYLFNNVACVSVCMQHIGHWSCHSLHWQLFRPSLPIHIICKLHC